MALVKIQSAEKIRPTALDHADPEHLQALQDKESHPTRQAELSLTALS